MPLFNGIIYCHDKACSIRFKMLFMCSGRKSVLNKDMAAASFAPFVVNG